MALPQTRPWPPPLPGSRSLESPSSRRSGGFRALGTAIAARAGFIAAAGGSRWPSACAPATHAGGPEFWLRGRPRKTNQRRRILKVWPGRARRGPVRETRPPSVSLLGVQAQPSLPLKNHVQLGVRPQPRAPAPPRPPTHPGAPQPEGIQARRRDCATAPARPRRPWGRGRKGVLVCRERGQHGAGGRPREPCLRWASAFQGEVSGSEVLLKRWAEAARRGSRPSKRRARCAPDPSNSCTAAAPLGQTPSHAGRTGPQAPAPARPAALERVLGGPPRPERATRAARPRPQ